MKLVISTRAIVCHLGCRNYMKMILIEVKGDLIKKKR
jgi:hypothetical protein